MELLLYASDDGSDVVVTGGIAVADEAIHGSGPAARQLGPRGHVASHASGPRDK